jgi:hypothetical protein
MRTLRSLAAALALLLPCAIGVHAEPSVRSYNGTVAIPVMFSSASIAANTTSFIGLGNTNTANANCFIAPMALRIKNFYLNTNNAPGTGQSFTITIVTGTPGTALTAPTGTITGLISNTSTLFTDTADTVSVSAGQCVAIKVVTSATSAATGVMSGGFEVDSP